MRLYIKPDKDGTYTIVDSKDQPVEEKVYTNLVDAYYQALELSKEVVGKDVVER